MADETPAVDPEQVYELVDADGAVAYRKGAHLDKALAMGMRLRTADEKVDAYQAESEEAIYSTPEQQAKAFIGSAAGGASLGLTDALDRMSASDEEWKATKLGRRHNPTLSTAGTVIGAVASAATGVGAAGAAAKLGSGIAKAAEGASALSKIARAGAGYGTEGALQGFGTGVQELVAADDPVTVQRAVSAFSSNVLFGGAVGGGVGLLGKAAGAGLAKGKALLDEAATKAKAGANVAEDLAGLDAKGLRVAKEAEIDRVVAEQIPQRAAVADEIVAHRKAIADSDVWLAADGEPSAQLTRTHRSLRGHIDKRTTLKERPYKAIETLQEQADALGLIADNGPATLAKLAAEDAVTATSVRKVMTEIAEGSETVTLSGRAAKKFTQFDPSVGRVSKKNPTIEVRRESADAFVGALERGEVQGARAKAVESAPILRDQTNALIAKIKAASVPKSELASARLTQIQDAADALAAGGGKKGLLEQMAQGSIMGGVMSAIPTLPFAGGVLAPLIGAKVASAVTGLVFGRTAKAVGEQSLRTAQAVAAFVATGKKVAPAAPVLATKVLSSVSFGPPSARAKAAPKASGRDDSPLLAAYRECEAGLLGQVVAGPDGNPVMRPEARRELAARLSALHVLSPALADQTETLAARRIEFLASKLPRRPDHATMQLGPDRWRPSDMEMRTWARYVAAVEDPAAVVERLESGTVTPEDAEAFRTVYPDLLSDVQRQIIEKLPELRESLPYKRRLALSIFSGVAVDPAMNPKILRVLQGTFSTEPGTEGGSSAPKAIPQYGNISQDATTTEPTAAQKRAG